MKLAVIVLLAAAGIGSGVSPGAAPGRVPVVVELFTSEGCSSCPPADAVLSKLAREQPVRGVQIVPLGLHVTYWDQLGWKDPASLAEATARQQDYGRVFGADRIYTPQAVVDGRDEAVGSDEAAVTRAIVRAAKQPHATVHLAVATDVSGTLLAHVTIDNLPSDVKEPLRTIVVLTEDGVTTVVKRGENGGRTLHHDAVVRRLSTSVQFKAIPAEWHRDRLRIVALVQGSKSQRIVGAATSVIQ